jgi:hypothetical protein
MCEKAADEALVAPPYQKDMAMQGNKVCGFCSHSTSGHTFQTRPNGWV